MIPKLRKALKNFVTITIPSFLVIFIILELFFRFIIPASEVPRLKFYPEERIFKMDTNAKREGLYTIGKAASQRGRWRINNDGWNSPVDYLQTSDKIKLAVFGDSYIEALQVDSDKSYPSLLRQVLSQTHEVYSFGISGAPLSEYLNYSRYANKHFNPDVLIFNVVHNDFDESILSLNSNDIHLLTLNANEGNVTENLPADNPNLTRHGWKKRLLLKSALFRYLYVNLHITQSIKALKQSKKSQEEFNANVVTSEIDQNKELIELAVDYILRKIREENPGKRVIFVMDAPREDIYKDRLENSSVIFLNQMLSKYAREYDHEILDLTSAMKASYDKNQVPFNSDLDGHWNEYGHQFVFEQIRELIK